MPPQRIGPEVRSIRLRWKYKVEARGIRERSEVSVAGEEENASVDTGLRDQRVA
jgi:hypothetical protein